jgi:Fe-S-cluster containining protein
MMKAFDCKMCGLCCFGEGGIFLQGDDVKKISQHLKVPPEAFVEQYCVDHNGRLYVGTDASGWCLFYVVDQGCAIHPVKPEPCRLWPFFSANVKDRDTWKAAQEACPGINPDCPFEDFQSQSPK